MTSIQWTDETWNPIVGCSRAGYSGADGQKLAHPGCKHCYAEAFTSRGLHASHAEASKGGKWTGRIIFQPERLAWPFERWRARKDGTGRRIFVASLSDLGHPSIPDEHRAAIYGAMLLSPWNTYQNLSKRPENIARFKREWSMPRMIDRYIRTNMIPEEGISVEYPRRWEDVKHIHEITSVSDQPTADAMIPQLLSIPAAVRGVSYEPAIGPVDFTALNVIHPHGHLETIDVLSGVDWRMEFGEPRKLDWIIVGGESGRGARPFDLEWARDVIRQGKAEGIPVFVKQFGRLPFSSRAGDGIIALRDAKGGDWSEWPEDLRVREYPT